MKLIGWLLLFLVIRCCFSVWLMCNCMVRCSIRLFSGGGVKVSSMVLLVLWCVFLSVYVMLCMNLCEGMLVFCFWWLKYG